MINTKGKDGHEYNIPTASEVIDLIVSDLTVENFERDIIVLHNKEGLQRISALHPSFMAMRYPLLFPYGEDGYKLEIMHIQID